MVSVVEGMLLAKIPVHFLWLIFLQNAHLGKFQNAEVGSLSYTPQRTTIKGLMPLIRWYLECLKGHLGGG